MPLFQQSLGKSLPSSCTPLSPRVITEQRLDNGEDNHSSELPLLSRKDGAFKCPAVPRPTALMNMVTWCLLQVSPICIWPCVDVILSSKIFITLLGFNEKEIWQISFTFCYGQIWTDTKKINPLIPTKQSQLLLIFGLLIFGTCP